MIQSVGIRRLVIEVRAGGVVRFSSELSGEEGLRVLQVVRDSLLSGMLRERIRREFGGGLVGSDGKSLGISN